MEPMRPGTSQTVAYDASVATSTAFPSGISTVRIVATTDCFVTLGTTPVATSADLFIPAGIPEYIQVKGGEKIAAIKSASAGTLYVTEVSD